MSEKIHLNKENMAIMLYDKKKQDWEDKTFSISAIFKAFYYGNFASLYFFLSAS